LIKFIKTNIFKIYFNGFSANEDYLDNINVDFEIKDYDIVKKTVAIDENITKIYERVRNVETDYSVEALDDPYHINHTNSTERKKVKRIPPRLFPEDKKTRQAFIQNVIKRGVLVTDMKDVYDKKYLGKEYCIYLALCKSKLMSSYSMLNHSDFTKCYESLGVYNYKNRRIVDIVKFLTNKPTKLLRHNDVSHIINRRFNSKIYVHYPNVMRELVLREVERFDKRKLRNYEAKMNEKTKRQKTLLARTLEIIKSAPKRRKELSKGLNKILRLANSVYFEANKGPSKRELERERIRAENEAIEEAERLGREKALQEYKIKMERNKMIMERKVSTADEKIAELRRLIAHEDYILSQGGMMTMRKDVYVRRLNALLETLEVNRRNKEMEEKFKQEMKEEKEETKEGSID
jgi:hypothetical protein